MRLLAPVWSSPLLSALLLAPLAAAVWLLARLLRRDSPIALGWRFLAFFLAFSLFFSLAAASDLLSGKRHLLAGYDEEVPANFLALNRLGDWHYRLPPPGEPVDDLIVVTFPSFAGELRAEVRRKLAFLLRKAREQDARGVAFDYFMERESAMDGLLVAEIEAAAAAGIPVILGVRLEEVDGELVERPLAASLAAATPFRGHLSGYLESDGRVRMVPLRVPGGGDTRSLSWRVAEVLRGGELPLESRRLLQVTQPRWGVPVVEFAPDMEWGRLRNRFVLVGTSAATDRVETPFGAVQGVEVHAWAADNLRDGRWIRRLRPRSVYPALFALCYLQTLLFARGAGRGALIVTAAGLSLLVVLAAALAMRGALVWIDICYPLAAIGLLTAVLVAVETTRARARPARRVPAPDAATEPLEQAVVPAPGMLEGDAFDVFLSHNGRDKPIVRRLATALGQRHIVVWLDEQQLVPGRPWQEGLEKIIRTVKSSAVLVGGDGLGPWEVPEMHACLSEAVRRGLPVIPVLLPGAGKKPALPLFLTQYTWVDLRAGLEPQGLDRLVWGITGVKP